MDLRHSDRTATRVAAIRRDLQALDAELAMLVPILTGPLPRVPDELLCKIEIAGDDLGYLVDFLRMLHPMVAQMPVEGAGPRAGGHMY